jgi:hypothetical protein
MKKKKLKKKIKRLKKKINWYHRRMIGDIISNNMREMKNGI